MKASVAAAAAFLTCITPAAAQSVIEIAVGAKFCKTLADNDQRLKCFDSLFADKAAAASPPAAQQLDTWQIEESKSPVDDSPQIVATLIGAAAPGEIGAVLILRCREHSTGAIFGKPMAFIGTQPTKVLLRINDAKAIETTWNPGSDGQAVFAPSAVQLIRALPDDGKLFMRASAYGGRSVDGQFDLGKVSAVRDKIAAACHWPSPAGQGTPSPK
jgi:type VI secretion system (T6SS) VasI/EvfG family protein